MSTHSFFIKSINKALIFGYFIAALFVTNGLNGQQHIGPYNIMLKDGWKHNNAKSDASEHYFFEKDGLTVAIPKSPQDAPAGVNTFILDYANKLKGTDEFIEQQKQSVPVSLYGKSQSARLTIKSKSTGVRRFVYLTMVDNKVYETLMQDNNNGTDPNGNIIQFLSQVSVDKNADNLRYMTLPDISPTQFPTNPGDAIKGGSPTLPHEQTEIKIAIIHEITELMNRYQNTCFGKKLKFGEPAKFDEAIFKKINFIYVGKAGTKRIKETGGDPIARHHSYPSDSGEIADLMFPFDPRDIPAGKDGDEKRKTLMHEMTHHIEFIKGIKESSYTGTIKKDLKSERNAEYQSGVFSLMKTLLEIEEWLAKPKSNIADFLVRFGQVEIGLHKLERGSDAGGYPPDENLDKMTGFNARYNLIEKHYLSGDCGPKLRNLVLLYRILGAIEINLDLDPVTINMGEEVVAKANLKYADITDVKKLDVVPAELKPVFSWELPDKRKITGNPLRYKPDKDEVIPVELTITFDKETMVLAVGNLQVTVLPNEKGTTVTSIKIPDKVLATELVDVEVTVPNDVKSKIVEYGWSPCASGPDKNTAKTKIQFSNPGDKSWLSNVSVYGKDASGNGITSVEKKVTVIPVFFPAPNLLPAGQEPSSGAWGVHVNGLYKDRIREGHVPSKIYIDLNISWISGDPSIKYYDWEKERQKTSNLKRKMIAFDGFNGFIYESEFKKDCRGSGYVDLGYIDCGISGDGIVIKGCIGIQFSYNVYGTGVIEGEGSGFCKFENLGHDDSEFLKAMILEAQQKVKSFIEGIKLITQS
jgi:hypothetical protein